MRTAFNEAITKTEGVVRCRVFCLEAPHQFRRIFEAPLGMAWRLKQSKNDIELTLALTSPPLLYPPLSFSRTRSSPSVTQASPAADPGWVSYWRVFYLDVVVRGPYLTRESA
jgi:hypothetical protein